MKIKLMMMTLLMCLLTFYSCEKDPISSPSITSPSITSPSITSPSITNNSVSHCISVQCYSTAKSTGNRCKNKTTNCNGRCYQHQ